MYSSQQIIRLRPITISILVIIFIQVQRILAKK